MKINSKKVLRGVILATFCLGTFSCKDTFDLAPKDTLELSQNYRNVFDADAAVIGLYGKFAGITDRYLVLNELRGDLEDVTPNSDKFLREINENSVSAANTWATPRPYYEIIINCNDVLKNFDIMLKEKRMSQTDYDIRYSEVGALRTWMYLQLGIQFGTVPYITDPLESVQSLRDETKFPKLTFDQLLATLIPFMEALPNKLLIPASSLNVTIDGYPTIRVFLNKAVLLGQLYLFKGDYPSAAKYYRQVLELGEVISSVAATDWYSIYTNGVNGGQSLSGGDWSRIYVDAYTARHTFYEMIWGIPFDKNFAPGNPLIPVFSPGADKWKIKPSQLSINTFNNETRSDGTPGDTFRGAIGKSYSISLGQTYVNKVVPNYNSLSPFEVSGRINMYRSGELHLEFAEAANRDGRDRIAYAFLNQGLRFTFVPIINGTVTAPANVTNSQTSFDTNPDYLFVARQGENPRYREKWGYHNGLRSRVSLTYRTIDSAKYFDMTKKGLGFGRYPTLFDKPVIDRQGLTILMEDYLVAEGALETAYEGHRWPTLIRIALRREKEAPGTGKKFLRDKVAAKFISAGLPVPAGVEKLGTDAASWYLPFNL